MKWLNVQNCLIEMANDLKRVLVPQTTLVECTIQYNYYLEGYVKMVFVGELDFGNGEDVCHVRDEVVQAAKDRADAAKVLTVF